MGICSGTSGCDLWPLPTPTPSVCEAVILSPGPCTCPSVHLTRRRTCPGQRPGKQIPQGKLVDGPAGAGKGQQPHHYLSSPTSLEAQSPRLGP